MMVSFHFKVCLVEVFSVWIGWRYRVCVGENVVWEGRLTLYSRPLSMQLTFWPERAMREVGAEPSVYQCSRPLLAIYFIIILFD